MSYILSDFTYIELNMYNNFSDKKENIDVEINVEQYFYKHYKEQIDHKISGEGKRR